MTAKQLRQDRPRSRLARSTVVALLVLVVFAWFSGDFDVGSLFTERSAANMDRFLGELRPFPLQGKAWDHAVAWQWLREALAGRGLDAMLATLALSVAAIALAGLFGGLLSMPAARNVANPEPFLPGTRAPGAAARAAWRTCMAGTRLLLVFLRAIPEYVWAFLFLGLLGPGAWPVVLALAIHTTGGRGKLNAEVI